MELPLFSCSLKESSGDKDGTNFLTGYWVMEELNNMSIPGYATGQVIPHTMQKHLAWLGDNPRETEVVSPLSAIRQALREEALSLGLGGTSGRIGDDRPIIIKQYLDGQQIMETVIRNGKVQQMSTGSNPFGLGTI